MFTRHNSMNRLGYGSGRSLFSFYSKIVYFLIFIWVLCAAQLCFSDSVAKESYAQEPLQNKPLTLTLLAPDGTPFWQRVNSFGEKAASDLGIKLVLISSAQSGDAMMAAARESIQNGTDGIITHGSDDAVLKVFKLAESNNIPVIVINADVTGGKLRPREKYTSWIGSVFPDDFEAGRTLARQLVAQAERLGRQEHHILALGGWPRDYLPDSSQVRIEGLLDYIESHEGIASIKIRPADWDPDLAKAIALEEWEKNPNISIIWSANDNMANAIIDLKRDKIISDDVLVGGIDWDSESASNIEKGLMHVSVGGHFLDGAWAVILLYDYLNGVDFSFQQLEYPSVMTAVERDTLARVEGLFKAKPEGIDFSDFSLFLNPRLKNYDFSLNRLFDINKRHSLSLPSELKLWLKNNPVVRVGSYDHSAPLSYFNAENEYQGVASGFLAQLEQQLGLKFRVQRYDSKKSLMQDLAAGQLDLVPMVEYTHNNFEVFSLSQPYLSYPLVIVGRVEGQSYKSLLDLTGRKVGLLSSESNSALNRKLIENHTNILFEYFTTFTEASQALSEGRVDALIQDLASATQSIHFRGQSGLRMTGETKYLREFSMAVAKNQPELLQSVNLVLNHIDPQQQAEIKNRWQNVQITRSENLLYLIKYFVGAGLLVLLLGFAAVVYIRKLKHAQQAIINANQAKSAFLANMSHEIRTPMNGILGLTAQALKNVESDKQKALLSNVQVSANHLLSVINDILDFSKIESGKLVFERCMVTLDDILSDVISLSHIKAKEKQISYEFQVDMNSINAFMGDPVRIKQVYLNLIGNALKFTEEGGAVKVLVRSYINNGRYILESEVIDNGIGISESNVEALFSPFSQADDSTTRRFGGTGLGLSICKQIVEMLGGEISVRSELGAGSTFYFCLSLEMVDDNKNCIKDLCLKEISELSIEHCGYFDGEACVTRRELERDPGANNDLLNCCSALGVQLSIQESPYFDTGGAMDVLIVNTQNVSAESAEAILQRLGSVPVLLLQSGYRSDVPDATKRRLEIVPELNRPFTPLQLTRSISVLLQGGRVSLPPEKQEPAGAGSNVDLKGCRVLLVEDNEINQQLALMLLEDVDAETRVAENGAEAIEILKQECFDLILMDCQMPIMDGYEAAQKIRENSQWDSIPIIAMTANAMKGDREKALASKMDDYITKPIDEETFNRVLQKWYSAESLRGSGAM